MCRRKGISFLAAIVVCVAASPLRAAANNDEDTDNDGIPDQVERRTATDPLRRDTDGDGVPDGAEDLDRDGRVDRHESDPRRAGLFPGTYPHIPEPMVFDLVRGLGARSGELEANTLVLVRTNDGRVSWAPEVEWAFADGHAIELELPMVDRHLEALKLALQGTLPNGHSSAFTHGWQTFAEMSLDDYSTESVLLYMFGHRLGRSWSYLTMIGGKATAEEQGLSEWAALLNASLFLDAREWLTLGIESNTSVHEHGFWLLRLFPQAHVQLSRRTRIQLSAGVDIHGEGLEPVVGTRLIME